MQRTRAFLNFRDSVDPVEVLMQYPNSVVLIEMWTWRTPHTEGGVLSDVDFGTDGDTAALRYISHNGPRQQVVDLIDIENGTWNQAETRFSFTDRGGITVTIVPLD